MGNVNMEARQIHVRDNNKKTWKTVADALKGLEASGESVAEDITELYTRDASRASKDDIAGEFSTEQAYYTGDYVYYEGSLFKFTEFHAAGEWDPAGVIVAHIGQNISTLESGLTDLSDHVDGDATVYPYADVITIEDAVPANLVDCMVKIEPIQSGTGTPSPENVRPITGHTECVVTVKDDAIAPSVTNTYILALGDTIYGGTVDFDSGVMTVTQALVDMGDFTWSTPSAKGAVSSTTSISGAINPQSNYDKANMDCSNYWVLPYYVDGVSGHDANSTDGAFGILVTENNKMFVRDSNLAGLTAEQVKTALTGSTVLFNLATPTTVQLTPEQIQLLQGTNTIYASTGDISVTVNGVSGAIGSLTSDKQDKTDYALETTAKTVVGAINEVSGNLSSKVGMSATDNLNITTNGVYTFNYNATGVPSNHSGVMLSIFNDYGAFGIQLAKVTGDNKIYIRSYDDTFTNWKELIDLT